MTDPPPGPHGPGAGKRPAAHAATTYVFEGCAATYWFDPDYRVYWTYCAWYTSDATTIKDYFAWTDTGWAFWFETEDYSLA
jgi:hypothetical protein